MATKRVPVLDGSDLVPTLLLPPLVQPSYRRPRWRDTAVYRETFQTGHGWTANGSGVAASDMNDTSSFVRGTQSVTVTSDGVLGHTAGVRKTSISGLSALDLTDKMFRLVVKVESNAVNLANLNFFIGTSGFTNYYKFVINPVTSDDLYFTEGQWVTATFGWCDLNSTSGSLTATNGIPNTFTGFTDLQVQVADDGSGNGVQLRVQAVEIVDSTTTTFPKGVVSLTFDDTWGSQWDNARPAMDTYGYRGTMYTIVDLVGTASHCTLDQLQRLQDQSGWEIAGHAFTASHHNTRLTNLTAAEVDADLGATKRWLIQNRFWGDGYAYPGGEFGYTTDNVWVEDIAGRYFSHARSILGQASRSIETFPAPMPHRMRSCSAISGLNASNGWTNPTGIAGTGGVLDRIAATGGWWIATFHEIVTGSPANSGQCSATDFATILAGINSRGITVLPVSDVMRHYG